MKTYREVIQQAEKQLFEEALADNQYNVSRTARVLRISRASLNYKLKEYFGDRYVKTRTA